MSQSTIIRILAVSLLGLSLSGCATYYQPRYGSDGVYFDQARAQPRGVIVADPLFYPYWSLDYFYFSRFYHPYSVVVHRFDPWFYPYPGWYYGYRPGPRSGFAFSGGFYYPWYAFGFSYGSHRPWRPHYVSYPRMAGLYSSDHPNYRVREIDQRLRLMEQRQARAAATAQAQPLRAHSEVMTRHRIAEDRAAASSRQRSTDTRPSAGTTRPLSTRPVSSPRSESRSIPSRSEGSPTTRERRQPPAPQASPSAGIDLSAFDRQRPASEAIRPAEPGARSAPMRALPESQMSAPRQHAPAQPMQRESQRLPEARPSAPAVRPPPAPRQSAPAPRPPAASRSPRQREIER